MESIISSFQNLRYKEWNKLKSRKHRDAKQLFFIEGVKMIEEAIYWGRTIEKFIYSEKLLTINGGTQIYEKISRLNKPIFKLENDLMERLSSTKNPQGILAILKQESKDINDIIKKYSSIIILEELQDPGNVGTIIRTADAAGFETIILSEGCVDLYNEKLIRATMGSIFHIPIVRDANINQELIKFKENKYQIIGSALNTNYLYDDLNYSEKKVLVIGNEAKGISESTADLCHHLVKIPIKGHAESLNAAIAAGILMYKMQGI